MPVFVLGWPFAAWAYRPFDSTDASVADLNSFEIELSPLSYRHDGEGVALIAPQARLNYGFAENWEVVLEGQADHFAHGRDELSAAELSVKTIHHEGSLQEKTGASLASEFSILLPGSRTDDGAGFQWTGIASQRWEEGAVHLNIGAALSRDQRAVAFAGLIVEGPDDWTVRPVAELTYEREFGAGEEAGVLAGLIWKAGEHLAVDLAVRHGLSEGHSDDQVRAGLTFGL
ncbi:MAG TPA: hypothetical protein VG501_05555 [Rhizomicrobium sp.]|nr:hypothetical protein [Rhizomicrobium sp.]